VGPDFSRLGYQLLTAAACSLHVREFQSTACMGGGSVQVGLSKDCNKDSQLLQQVFFVQ
jgi:hypothetical protein